VFGSFHAMFFAAAGLYLCAACLWLVIDPARKIAEECIPCE
jgi:hypothetical protein